MMGLVNAHLHERKMKLLAIFTSSMRFCYNRGGEKDIDNEEYKYKINGKRYLTLHGMKRINQDMGLCTR